MTGLEVSNGLVTRGNGELLAPDSALRPSI